MHSLRQSERQALTAMVAEIKRELATPPACTLRQRPDGKYFCAGGCEDGACECHDPARVAQYEAWYAERQRQAQVYQQYDAPIAAKRARLNEAQQKSHVTHLWA
jgi:hypothetical protein